ncbi:hypothetical protein GmRootV213_56580 (plasmid) [Variovorax sp. V213]
MTDEDSTSALKLPERQLRALSSKAATGYSRPEPDIPQRLSVNPTKQYIDLLWKHQDDEVAR